MTTRDAPWACVGAALAALAAAGAGCVADQGPPSTPEVHTAPLGVFSVTVDAFAVPLMTDSCYSLTVYGTSDPAVLGSATEVWSATHLCASTDGAPGAFLDVLGACDPDAPGPSSLNTVSLSLDALYLGGDASGEGAVLSPEFYLNPCPAGAHACATTVPCDAGGSGHAGYELVVSAFADLGVPDVRISLGELACSARFDCVDLGGQPLRSLPVPGTGEEGLTAAFGFACAAPAAAGGAQLYLDALVITCDGAAEVVIDPSGAGGHALASDPDGLLFGAAVHAGDGTAGRTYWNLALGLDLAALATAGDCTLTAAATATEGLLCETPLGRRYPILHWEVPLTAQGALACTRHGVGGTDGALFVAYTPLDAPWAPRYRMAHGASGAVDDLTAGACDGEPR